MARRRSPLETLAAWLVTGPVGHLVAGVADAIVLVAHLLWARVRGRATS